MPRFAALPGVTQYGTYGKQDVAIAATRAWDARPVAGMGIQSDDMPDIGDAADQRDIAASISGDGDAYARLVRRYENLVARQLWRFTRNPLQLEELVQEVFVETYTSLPGYRGNAPFLHWLRRITTRVGYRFWTKQTRDKERMAAIEAEAATDPLGTPAPEPMPSAAEEVFRLLESFPPDDRLVLTLLYLEECDTKEIAERMGWSRSLVKVRAFRARKRLRALLEERGYGGVHDG